MVYLLFLFILTYKKHADIIDPLAVQLEQRGRYSGFGDVLTTVLFLSVVVVVAKLLTVSSQFLVLMLMTRIKCLFSFSK